MNHAARKIGKTGKTYIKSKSPLLIALKDCSKRSQDRLRICLWEKCQNVVIISITSIFRTTALGLLQFKIPQIGVVRGIFKLIWASLRSLNGNIVENGRSDYTCCMEKSCCIKVFYPHKNINSCVRSHFKIDPKEARKIYEKVVMTWPQCVLLFWWCAGLRRSRATMCRGIPCWNSFVL